MTIDPKRAYLTRHGRRVTIAGPAPHAAHSRFQWITSRGYYVTADGRASHRHGAETSLDLVVPAESVK